MATNTELAPRIPSPAPRTTWEGITGAWLAEVTARTGSKRTPGEYSRYLARFMAEVGGDPAQATTATVHAFAYGEGPHGRQPSPSTVIVRLAALRSFYDFARRMGMVADNPTVDVKRPKARPPVPRGLEVEELQRLLAVIPDTVVGKRDRAIVLVAVFTGLRRQEIIGLKAGDLTRNGSVYYNVRVKGGATRRRELPQPAFNAILDALVADGRPLEGLAPDDSLFNISDVTFYAYLRKYAKRAGLEGLKPHDLRHTAAKMRRNNGASIEDVGALLGHASIATTARYLARMEGEADSGWEGVAAALGVA